jgi:hypothetical protein
MTGLLDLEQALERLRRAHLERLAAEEDEFRAVAAARQAEPPATWDQIADAVGMIQNNAWRKYKGRIQESTTVTLVEPKERPPAKQAARRKRTE